VDSPLGIARPIADKKNIYPYKMHAKELIIALSINMETGSVSMVFWNRKLYAG